MSVVRPGSQIRPVVLIFAVALVGSLGRTSPAPAFYSEVHTQISGAAFSCSGSGRSNGTCFEKETLLVLEGHEGEDGAVLTPDSDERRAYAAHCDNADYLFLPGRRYPQSEPVARKKLENCILRASKRFNHAVNEGEMMAPVSASGGPVVIDPAKTSISPPCPLGRRPEGLGKCDLLSQLGRALHGAQDFHAHSNWNDRPSEGRVSVKNPPGLAEPSIARFFDLRNVPEAVVIPRLVTGCWWVSELASLCRGRITHATLAKDEPGSPRGQLPRSNPGANYRYAWQGAVDESKRVWREMREQILFKYGSKQGGLIICAATHDDPPKECEGRKFAIVIDSSWSNRDTDPKGLRISAARKFNRTLLTKAQVAKLGRGTPDQSAVIKFSGTASVVSPLADPSAARFEGIDANGTTCMGCGIELARKLLVASTAESRPFDRFGIVVLSDLKDKRPAVTAAALKAAAGDGIRISIGFLVAPKNPLERPAARASAAKREQEVFDAVERAGGLVATVSSPTAAGAFVNAAIAHGVTTANDVNGKGDGGALGRGVRIRARIQHRDNVDVWTYAVRSGQRAAVTLAAPPGRRLRMQVRLSGSGRVVRTAIARGGKAATVVFAPRRHARNLEVHVSSPDGRKAGYRIGVDFVRPSSH